MSTPEREAFHKWIEDNLDSLQDCDDIDLAVRYAQAGAADAIERAAQVADSMDGPYNHLPMNVAKAIRALAPKDKP